MSPFPASGFVTRPLTGLGSPCVTISWTVGALKHNGPALADALRCVVNPGAADKPAIVDDHFDRRIKRGHDLSLQIESLQANLQRWDRIQFEIVWVVNVLAESRNNGFEPLGPGHFRAV